MSDNKPLLDQPPMQRPDGPKHVPFWPFLVGMAFLVAVVIAGIISSNNARGEHLTIVTSTLPPRNAKPTTTTVFVSSTSTTILAANEPTTVAAQKQAATAGSDACTSNNLVNAAVASGKVDERVLGTVTAPQFKCVSGYALARLVPSAPDEQSVTADYKLTAGTWQMLNLGDVNPPSDGVPSDIAAQLTLTAN